SAVGDATGARGMRRVEPDPDESRRKLWRAENSLATHARCSPPGLSRIASLIGKIQACRPLDHSSGANGCFTSCGGNAHADREWQLATLSGHSASHSERLFLSLRGHPDLEATVAARGDVVAGLPVDPDAADIGHQDARLAGDVGAHVPRVGARIERLIADLVDMRDPALLRLRRGFDGPAATLHQIGDAVGARKASRKTLRLSEMFIRAACE